MPQWTTSLFDLLREWRDGEQQQRDHHPRWPLLIPDREILKIRADAFNGGTVGPDDLARALEGDGYSWQNQYYRVWVHIEGLFIPRDLYFHGHGDDFDDGTADELIQAWRRLTGRVIRLLTSATKEPMTTSDQIGRWIGARAKEAETEVERAQITALADAVLEGRYAKNGPTT